MTFRGFWAGTGTENYIGAAFLEPFPGSGAMDYLVGSKVTGTVAVYRLEDGALPSLVDEIDQSALPDGYVSGGAFDPDPDDGGLWLWDGLTGQVCVLDGPDERSASTLRLQNGQPLTATVIAPVENGFVVAPASRDELLLLQQVAGQLRVADRVTDDAKSTVSGMSDLLPVQIGDRAFLISASHEETGLSCFELAEGRLIQKDHIGAKDGLWANGVSRLLACQIEGETFVIALSAKANALHSLRLNEHGVFFTADSFWDNRETRFEGAQDMDLFSWQGRDFLVTGGQGAGLSLIEILPGGVLLHHQSIAQSGAWDIGPIAQIEAQVIGDDAQIMVTGSQGAGVAHLTLGLSGVGLRMSGTDGSDTLRGDALENLLLGGAGNDRLRGSDGDDILFAGTGSDALSGEAGADVFVFEADGQRDRITDFEQGLDRIDLSGWGRLYHHGDLSIEQTQFGARISWQREQLDIYSATGLPIAVEDWGADDFIF